MAGKPPTAPRDLDPLPALAEALVPHLEPHFRQPAQSREFYSQRDSPLGSRHHLKLARTGTLVSYKVGRLVLVRRDELHRFIESHATTSLQVQETEDDVLADWDLEPEDV